MQKELQKHYHNVNFLNIFQTQTFSKQLLLNRLLWNLVPKTAHFLGYILNLYVFSRLIISISRQITDIYPASSSDYPALALIQLGSTFNHNLLYTENRDYIRAFAPQNGKKSQLIFKYYSGSIYQFSETRDIIIRRILIKRKQTASIFLHTHSIRQSLTTGESHIINTHTILSQIREAEGERNDKLT